MCRNAGTSGALYLHHIYPSIFEQTECFAPLKFVFPIQQSINQVRGPPRGVSLVSVWKKIKSIICHQNERAWHAGVKVCGTFFKRMRSS